ncbi:hypothetical protein [Clostridium lacusfryxellense]|uniref:hypothetical protein n=1 Tax=Clostridium lacusfryxellense TaxID=205328 RepID=UPI001C0B3AD3|nr:hypothetical protein [Clostridium lacusfryxellense]MBU3110405.1 hypothetical protein [Clostridium lacusfryxellense]
METSFNEAVNVNEIPMTIGQWLVTLLVMGIPIVGFVLAIVWATGHDVNRSKKTFCQASLIFGAIVLVLYVIFFALFASVMSDAMNSISGY